MPTPKTYRSFGTPEFWEDYRKLPALAREHARQAYREWSKDARARHFKTLSSNSDYCSVRIDGNYRFVGILAGDTVNWFWVGTHDEFDAEF